MQEAINRAENGVCSVRADDICLLFDAIKRFGGRHDWKSTEDNIKQLPPPVQLYIYDLRTTITQLHYRFIEARQIQAKIEHAIALMKRPPR